jgi:hypothetical protein
VDRNTEVQRGPKCRSLAWTEMQKFSLVRNAGLTPAFRSVLDFCISVHIFLVYLRPRLIPPLLTVSLRSFLPTLYFYSYYPPILD